jgi:hypothetical protein
VVELLTTDPKFEGSNQASVGTWAGLKMQDFLLESMHSKSIIHLIHYKIIFGLAKTLAFLT